jgi:hypothetical protein
MPDFIKFLGDIKEGCGAVGFVFRTFVDSVDDAMCFSVVDCFCLKPN